MKFTIRDLFLVPLIVAILVAWWMDRSRLRIDITLLQWKVNCYELRGPEEGPLPTSSASAAILRIESARGPDTGGDSDLFIPPAGAEPPTLERRG